ncbi:MAG: chemotaxis protein, partial [Mollicutes bacterium]|nr:chemotaxis protein [Mollicutes bacterium]
MKGTVVGTWVSTAHKIWGEDLAVRAMEHVGWPSDKIFLPTEEIEDAKPKNFAAFLARKTGKSEDEIWLAIGKDNIGTFFNSYPAFFRQESLYSFLRSMYDVHVVMVKRIPGANPPELLIESVSEYEAVLSYRSKRGMFGYLKGLLAGAAEHFKEDIATEVIESASDAMKIKIRFPKPITSTITYSLNQALGFTKSLPVKIGVAAAIVAAIINGAFVLMGANIPLWTALVSGVAAGLGAGFLLRPFQAVRDELKAIQERVYFTETKLKTADEFEEIFDTLAQYKKRVKSEFTGFKGISDEMDRYADNFNSLSDRMRETSNEISGVVYDVATAATNQAQETEHAVGILNGNLETLTTVVTEQTHNKQQLESAVDEIDKGFEEVQASSTKLADSMQKFSDVKCSAS